MLTAYIICSVVAYAVLSGAAHELFRHVGCDNIDSKPLAILWPLALLVYFGHWAMHRWLTRPPKTQDMAEPRGPYR